MPCARCLRVAARRMIHGTDNISRNAHRIPFYTSLSLAACARLGHVVGADAKRPAAAGRLGVTDQSAEDQNFSSARAYMKRPPGRS